MSLKRRQLDLRSGDAVIAEIQMLRGGGYRRLKSWNLTQICDHLDRTMAGEMDGLGFRLPWILRRTAGNWLTRRVLRTRRMPSVPTLPRLRPQSDGSCEDDQVIDACLNTIRRSMEFTGPLDDYPFVDDLSHDQWREFMWIHASHHLSFLLPQAT